jgi:hypothetical protein
VTYSGTGMTPGMLARGFEPLFATRPAEQDGESSVSMVRGFSQHFQGQVCIRSKPRRGTTVKLYLPNYRDPAAADVGAASMPGVEAPPTRAAARVPEPNFAKRAQAKTSAPQHTTAGYG